MLIISSFVWVLPFVVVALAAVRIPLAHKKYARLVCGAFAGTVLFEILSSAMRGWTSKSSSWAS